jgi:hypothetical protein
LCKKNHPKENNDEINAIFAAIINQCVTKSQRTEKKYTLLINKQA